MNIEPGMAVVVLIPSSKNCHAVSVLKVVDNRMTVRLRGRRFTSTMDADIDWVVLEIPRVDND